MNLIRCDECQKEIEESIHWYSVTVEGIAITKREKPETHFCRRACVGLYFSKAAQAEEGVGR